jgi:Zn-finger nucleic acid-binding protein
MHHLTLAGRLKAVMVDHCQACRLVWFDPLESVQLVGLGWVSLLRELQPGAHDAQAHPKATALNCPVCRAALKQVHNRSRFGRFPALECPRCQGHLHSHSGLLAERGLVRPLLRPERLALAEERRSLCCLNCGAPSDGRGEDCSYCASPLVMLDLPRLAHALLLRPGRQDEPSPRPEGKPLAWACRGCGAALDPSRQTACPQCGHAVVAPSLLDITPLLDRVEAELRAETASKARPPHQLSRRQRDWRETGLARLLHRLSLDEAETATLGWQLGGAALLLLLWWWLGS